jgi:hypothetical protein
MYEVDLIESEIETENYMMSVVTELMPKLLKSFEA